MRILCGILGPTSGRAMVDGQDVLEHPGEVKQKIGYLPEVPPVYPTMTVSDYVVFAAKIRAVKDPGAAAARAMKRVGLDAVSHRIIGHLSKGYRQRVGIAQALVHDPKVLVLDEPTSGLDPAQRKEIRELLGELAEGERTVILSTHVMAEIEAVCQRVVIISQGRIVAQDRIDALSGGTNRVKLRVARPDARLDGALRAVAGVVDVVAQADGSLLLSTQEDVREQVARAAVDFGLIELSPGSRLEDVYLNLTRGGGE
jgi:ABC-2 type transport system ATP-binding protein